MASNDFAVLMQSGAGMSFPGLRSLWILRLNRRMTVDLLASAH